MLFEGKGPDALSGWGAIGGLIELLRRMPPEVVPASHVGLVRPSASGDLPAVVVSAEDIQEHGGGIGGLAGSRSASPGVWTPALAHRCAGVFRLELWAADEARIRALADAVFGVMSGPHRAEAGFLRLATRSIDAIDSVPIGPAGVASAMLMPITAAFVFEEVVAEETGPGGVIKRIQVGIHDTFDEAMDVT